MEYAETVARCASQAQDLLERLFPLPRCLAGRANRETLRALAEVLPETAPMTIHEYPSGTPVYDWTVPQEWRVNEAWIEDEAGRRLLDYADSNLHVASHSVAAEGVFSHEELLPRLHTLPDQPAAVPYRTLYYKEDWAFCLSHQAFLRDFAPGKRYRVRLDAERLDGSMSVGEVLAPGHTDREILVSTYICHPSLANDNLSGPVMTALLAREAAEMDLLHSLRIVFVPETVGAIAYAAHNGAALKAIDAGFVVTCVGGRGPLGYKQSFCPDHAVNHAVKAALAETGRNYVIYPFDIHGSDERQYSSPGFRINTATISKGKYYEFPEYHTSLDDLELVTGEAVADSLALYLRALDILDADMPYVNLAPHGEPMLSKRGLYADLGGAYLPEGGPGFTDLVLALMFYGDGTRTLLDVARELGVDAGAVKACARQLEDKGLIRLGD